MIVDCRLFLSSRIVRFFDSLLVQPTVRWWYNIADLDANCLLHFSQLFVFGSLEIDAWCLYLALDDSVLLHLVHVHCNYRGIVISWNPMKTLNLSKLKIYRNVYLPLARQRWKIIWNLFFSVIWKYIIESLNYPILPMWCNITRKYYLSI